MPSLPIPVLTPSLPIPVLTPSLPIPGKNLGRESGSGQSGADRTTRGKAGAEPVAPASAAQTVG